MRPRVSVIVPARDAEHTLARTLSCLVRQRLDEPYEVIVVDDGSEDATASIAAGFGDPVRLVRGGGEGSGAARNLGVSHAQGEVIAFTDADCFPTEGWLGAGLRALEGHELVAGAVAPDPSARMGAFDRSVWVERETGLYETANLLVRRSLFDRIGGFEPWLTDEGRKRGWTNPELAEDVWLGWRARRAGARTAFAPDALVHHAVHARGPGGYVSERWRRRHFPAIAARVPELRSQFFYRRVFLSRRSALFDLALAGGAAAMLTRSKLPLLVTVPYAREIARRAKPYRRRAPLVAAVELAGDAVSSAALAGGSIRNRSVVM
jgi:glycosyltransferase involved in cell wall biosynthesis